MDIQIIQALERIATLMKIHMWEIAGELALSPLQIQILFILKNKDTKAINVADALGLKKPTISHTVKILLNKRLISKKQDPGDARSDILSLTKEGNKHVQKAEHLRIDLIQKLESLPLKQLNVLYFHLYQFIDSLQKAGLIPLQASCFQCKSYSLKDDQHYCDFLRRSLEITELKIECPDFQQAIA